ncbi:MAG: PhoH family protein [Porphyromonas sp.]|nr:PhoH family protein [Bacteroidales bacterium]MDY3101275.1 PhoH family protein [Porphyromonas sp.]
MAKKNYVIDTNVILHDYNCISNFQDNDVYIPITVLEELDKFKKGYDQLNFNARAFGRLLDEMMETDKPKAVKIMENGIQINSDGGRLFILTNGQRNPKVTETFSSDLMDHRILSAALTLAEEKPKVPTILVTKDVNLRIKAVALGMKAEDYTTDQVDVDDIFSSTNQEVMVGDSSVIDSLYVSKHGGVALEEGMLPFKPTPNQTFELKSATGGNALVRVDSEAERIYSVEKRTMMGITPRNAEQTLAFDVLSDPNLSLIALTGTAGTGKTLLALAAALSQADDYQQILLARPIVSLSNKDIGFLPGGYKEKVMPYMQPLFDNLNVIKASLGQNSNQAAKLDEMLKGEKLVIEALAFIRGRSLNNVICIIDEAQNLTPQEIKTIITRAGENTRMIFTGDVQQIDQPYLEERSNGLSYMIERMRGESFFAHVNLVKGERSKLSEAAAKKL